MTTCGRANLKKGPRARDAAQEIDTPRAVAPPQVDEWLCGYAAALAAVQRLYHESSLVKNVMICDGITVAHLRTAGVEEFDLIQIVKAVGK